MGLFLQLPYYSLLSETGWSEYRIRLSIFLIFTVISGVPALVWALIVLRRHHKRKGRISVFIILVLLNDVLELLLNPYIATTLIQGGCDRNTDITCRTLSSLSSGSRLCGVYLQQMMVFESVLALRHPSCSAHVFFPHCSIIISLLMFVCFFLCQFFTAREFLLLSLLPLLAVTVTSWIITCRRPPIKTHSSDRTKKQDRTVLAFATISMIIYLTFITLYVFVYIWSLETISTCLLSLRVTIDPLLCVLVSREKHLSTDQTTVEDES
ncbi:uncharacterized protein LOC118816909 [Colossoma macropomum]|uniref:uncharacterized protein LOC118816909 n=1 Tax=Colossoma macropomum TaxID=42526 RepID=UPI001864F58E|nr:uncharacterized protein LOC118816909 [Colossoma macropomum]